MRFINVFLTSLLIIASGFYITTINSKEKSEYMMTSGVIEYLEKEYQTYPLRDHGKYRFLKIDTYPYVFSIYEPNSLPVKKHIDDLKLGDQIDIYYYENNWKSGRETNL